jgi:hypothetical protein
MFVTEKFRSRKRRSGSIRHRRVQLVDDERAEQGEPPKISADDKRVAPAELRLLDETGDEEAQPCDAEDAAHHVDAEDPGAAPDGRRRAGG